MKSEAQRTQRKQGPGKTKETRYNPEKARKDATVNPGLGDNDCTRVDDTMVRVSTKLASWSSCVKAVKFNQRNQLKIL